jgi:hypothetical protein
MAYYDLKLLNSMTCLIPNTNLSDINVTLRVHRHGVAMRKFPGLVPRAAKSR